MRLKERAQKNCPTLGESCRADRRRICYGWPRVFEELFCIYREVCSNYRGIYGEVDDQSRSLHPQLSRDRIARRSGSLCCRHGFLGDPIDPVYEDRELFADFLTTYYTDHEPESSFLLEVDGEIRGYLLGSRKPLRNQLYCVLSKCLALFPRAHSLFSLS